MRRYASLLVMLLSLPATFPGFAAPAVYTGPLAGASEVPPNGSSGTGLATVSYNPVTGRMSVDVTFDGLIGTIVGAHIHCCTSGPGVNAAIATTTPSFPGFPGGVSSGAYLTSFDMSSPGSYNAAFLASHGNSTAAALAALLDGMGRGGAYFNIHTVVFPGGEIRADLFEQPVFTDGFQ
jgi:hypothetical protein